MPPYAAAYAEHYAVLIHCSCTFPCCPLQVEVESWLALIFRAPTEVPEDVVEVAPPLMEEVTLSAMLRLGPLARLARAHVLGDVHVLPHPEGEAANERPRLGPSEVPPEWSVVALAENLRPQTPPRGNAQPVRRSALPPTVQQATPHRKRPAGRGE